MGRTPIPDEEANKALNVKVPPEDLLYVQEVLKPELGVLYNADVVRELLKQLRTTFGLPGYMAKVIERDRKEKKQNIVEYLQELLSRRSEELRSGKPAEGETGQSKSRRR